VVVEGILETNGLVAVKVDNAPNARPQVGLRDLPLLIEYPVEGGITRMVAVLREGATGHVGPIRSLRPIDADLLPLFAPVTASTGGQPFVLGAVEAAGIVPVLPGALGVFDLGDRPAPHNFFLNTDALLPRLGDYGPKQGALPSGETTGDEPASSIALPIGAISFEFSDGAYTRSQEGRPFEVLDDIRGVSADLEHDTIVVLHATQRSAGYFDANCVEVPTFDVIGGGKLLLFTGGEVTHGSWLRQGVELPYEFYDMAGRQIGIREGRVYMAIVPRETDVTFSP
jgi:hypothetical protein